MEQVLYQISPDSNASVYNQLEWSPGADFYRPNPRFANIGKTFGHQGVEFANSLPFFAVRDEQRRLLLGLQRGKRTQSHA